MQEHQLNKVSSGDSSDTTPKYEISNNYKTENSYANEKFDKNYSH